MAKIFKIIFFIGFIHNVYCDELLSLPHDEPETKVINVEEPTEPKKQNLVTIDLSQCSCTEMSTCDLTILKSPLMDITCSDGESLCCPMTKTTDSSFSSEVENNAKKDEPATVENAPRSNIRVYTITPTFWKDFNSSSSPKKSQKSKSNCVCKARSSCPHKYIDYGFGFHCTYSTVRCCIPEADTSDESSVTVVESEKVEVQQPAPSLSETETEKVEQLDSILVPSDMDDKNAAEMDMPIGNVSENMTFSGVHEESPLSTLMEEDDELQAFEESPETVEISEDEIMDVKLENITSLDINEDPREDQMGQGELIITEVTNWDGGVEDGNEFQNEEKCFCLPIQKCRMETSNDLSNMIERRRDTLCPGDLVQCCGSRVMEEITKKKDEVAGEFDTNNPIRSDVIESQTPFSPSPEIYHPQNETGFGVPAPAPVQAIMDSSVLPPPYQGYQPPGFYKGYQSPQTTNSYPVHQQTAPIAQNYGQRQQQQQPSVYVPSGGQNGSPWMYSKYVPQQVGNGQHYGAGYQGRVPYTEGETARHQSGGLFDSLAKLWG